MIIILDTFPTSSVAKRPAKEATLSDQCREWVYACEAAGHTIQIPAVVYYEALRELEQRQALSQMERLNDFCLLPTRYIPMVTEHWQIAARLWGQARRDGRPTASADALDGDVILAAQVLSLGLAASEYIVATTNIGHIVRFVSCDEWQNIIP